MLTRKEAQERFYGDSPHALAIVLDVDVTTVHKMPKDDPLPERHIQTLGMIWPVELEHEIREMRKAALRRNQRAMAHVDKLHRKHPTPSRGLL